MGFDDGSAQVRNIRDPGQPTAKEHQEHMTTHRRHRSWCHFCMMGRGVNSPHRRSDLQDDFEGVRHVSMDNGFLGERESEDRVSPVLVIRARQGKTRRHGEHLWIQEGSKSKKSSSRKRWVRT